MISNERCCGKIVFDAFCCVVVVHSTPTDRKSNLKHIKRTGRTYVYVYEHGAVVN